MLHSETEEFARRDKVCQESANFIPTLGQAPPRGIILSLNDSREPIDVCTSIIICE